MSATPFAPQALRDLATRILVAAGTSPGNATSVAAALVAAELDGIPSHGLSRLPSYADQVVTGKIDGRAVPLVARPSPSIVKIDACSGFAFPAIEAGLDPARHAAREAGIIALAIANSHHCGVAGHHVERLAETGLVALLFANTPGAIAPWGGKRPVFGTNPLAFACPRADGPPLVVDLSMSLVARGKVVAAAGKGEVIPEGWALDKEGEPTTDPQAALAGTMVPIGGAKGAALALVIEILAAGLTGAQFGFEASSFLDAARKPPRVGQLFLVFDPAAFATGFVERVGALTAAMLDDPGVRLPGVRRLQSRAHLAEVGISLPDKLVAELHRRDKG